MNDEKIREEFQLLESYRTGGNWVKWNGEKYVKSCNGHNNTADSWAYRFNKELNIYKAGALSQQPKIETLTARVAVAEGKVVELKAENKKLKAKVEGLKHAARYLLVNESNWKHCPDCPDQGWYIVGPSGSTDPEQEQCEFCWTNPKSAYNQKSLRDMIKGAE